MEKNIIVLLALLTSLTAGAGITRQLPRQQTAKAGTELQHSQRAHKAPRRAEGNAQTYVGYVNESSQLNCYNFNDGLYKICAIVQPSLISKYVGCQIVGVRFLLNSTALKDVEGWITADPEDDSKLIAKASVASVSAEDWNVATFQQPYTITGANDEALFMGFTYNSTSADDYPLIVDDSKQFTNSLLLYADLGKGFYWYDASFYYGTPAVQLIIEGNLPDYDLALGGFALEHTYVQQKTEQMRFYVELTNQGSKPISGAVLNVYVDEQPIGAFRIEDEISGNMPVMENIDLASLNLGLGKHTVALAAAEQKDGTPFSEGTTDDDAVVASFYLYENAATRTGHLVEVYANQYSYQDSLQLAALQQLMLTRSDIVPVVLHGNFYGEQYTDQFATDEALGYGTLFRLMDTPSIAIDRFVFPGATEMLQLGSQATFQSGYLGGIVDYIAEEAPAFANVAIDTPTLADGKLTITVTATRGGDFRNIFGNGALTVMLTEDSLVAMQECVETTKEDFVHNNVLRRVVSGPVGDELEWSGLRATKSYTVDVDPEWKLENMNVVAFLAKPITDDSALNDVDVTDAVSLSLRDLTQTDAVRSILTINVSETQTFDLAGRQVNTLRPQRGIYVRNGHKVVVR